MALRQGAPHAPTESRDAHFAFVDVTVVVPQYCRATGMFREDLSRASSRGQAAWSVKGTSGVLMEAERAFRSSPCGTDGSTDSADVSTTNEWFPGVVKNLVQFCSQHGRKQQHTITGRFENSGEWLFPIPVFPPPHSRTLQCQAACID